MKVIIAGGRDYFLTPADYSVLDLLHTQYSFTEVIHGNAQGADQGGKQWAMRRGLCLKAFEADWANLSRRAGPLRNTAMIGYATGAAMLIVFPGGRGTADITRKAHAAGLCVINAHQFKAEAL
jgi:hypothetical protein